jgi:predicted anti-sigma-YlaC factor YlaD
VLAAIGFIALALFQAALAAGAPWGEAAWGGGDSHLSAAQRGASAVAAVIYVAAALIVLGRAGIWGTQRNGILYRWGTWFIAVAMAIGALPNFISQSRRENFIFGPLAPVLAVLCVVVARSSVPGPARGRTHTAEPQGAGHRNPPSKTWAGRARPRRPTGLLLNSIQA